jgi:MOSC domain-containing protein YiiM
MQLLSVNIGQPRALKLRDTAQPTGIYKEPSPQPVQVTSLGLAGDYIGSKKHHGGPDQAVYIYTEPDYDWWAQVLGSPLAPGAFGDNLTISGLESAPAAAGDRLTIGEVVFEVTSPRIPCATLAARMDDRAFVKRFRQAERPGIYCRVIATGRIEAGQAVDYTPYAGERISMLEQFRDYYEPAASEAAIRRMLAAPIAIRTRAHLEERLASLLQK